MEDDDTELSALTTYQLIDRLDKQYPHQCIRPGETIENAWRYAGFRELIDLLVQVKNDEIEARNPKGAL